MRVLIINKFLYPNGGSETYIFKLGEALEQHGHEVQYFGMEHEGRCVGNRVNAYTSDMDFHGGSKLSKLTYPIKTIYSNVIVKIGTVLLILLLVKSPNDVWKYTLIMSGGTLVGQLSVWPILRNYVCFIRPKWNDVIKHLGECFENTGFTSK